GRRAPGPQREPRAQGRRDQTGVRAGLPGHSHRLRRSERSGEPGVAARGVGTRREAARGIGRRTEHHLSEAASHGMTNGKVTPERMTEDLLRPLLKTSWHFYVIVLILGGVVSLGVGAFAYQVNQGIGVWGLNWPVFWAFDITNFVFWIGISHAGTLISAI